MIVRAPFKVAVFSAMIEAPVDNASAVASINRASGQPAAFMRPVSTGKTVSFDIGPVTFFSMYRAT